MFARVTTTQGSPEQYDETARYTREQLVPAVQGMPGLKGAYFFGDRQTGKGISITLWETEESMRASAEMANQVRAQAVESMTTSLQSVESYEVIAHI